MLDDILKKIENRQCYPVALGKETVYVRAMSIGELEQVDKLQGGLKTGMVMGCCLVNESGKPVFPRDTEQTEEAFARHVLDAMANVGVDTIRELSTAIGRVSRTATTPAESEELEGN